MSLSHLAARRAGAGLAALAAAAALAPAALAAPPWPTPSYLEPLAEIDLRGGRLGWDGVVVGMTFEEVRREIGRLAAPTGEAGMLCPFHRTDAVVDGQRLGLEFSGTGDDAVLRAIHVPLAPRIGEAFDSQAVVAALRRRLELEWVPSPHAPVARETDLEKPLYRTADGELVFVNPETGVVIGEVCVD